MKSVHRGFGLVSLVFVLTLCAGVPAAAQDKGLIGDWDMKMNFDGRQMASILSFARDKGGELTGRRVSLWGISELKEIKREGKDVSFVLINRRRGEETESSFIGTLEKGKLSGVLTSDRGEVKAEGKKIRPMPRILGSWNMTFKIGEQEVNTVLVVSADKQKKLRAEWQSEWGEHEITDVRFKDRKLTFNRVSTFGDRKMESTYEGTLKGHTLNGMIESELGEIAAKGERVGAAVVGRWRLEIASESGTRTQMLRVHPDLSGLYGPVPIKRVRLDGKQMGFKTGWEFGERTIEISFAGQVEGRKLTGELTSNRGSRQVEGQKITPARAKESSRKPDVIFVPTPQHVVEKMLEIAKVTKEDLIYDLGCGDGRIVVTAAKKYGCKGVGYDISRKRVKESLENVEKNNVADLVRIERKDIFTLDLSEASVITLYLLPQLNVKLIPQLDKLKPGTRIVSHDFDMKGVRPDKVVVMSDEEDDYGDHTVYLWTTPLNKEEVSEE
ncbi:MAG: methyltransferase domain-containing protein [Phycisphaerales bacterium]|nr:MAG: methyltransferase domain-containing protein [Phycisphaerales bacterium]